MFTLWPAYASFREKDLGTIEPGKLADFTGFSGDIMTVPEADILKVDAGDHRGGREGGVPRP